MKNGSTMKKRVLVTGASGMLGRFVCTAFVDAGGYEVYGASRNSIDLPRVQYIKVNLLQDDQVRKMIDSINPDIIVHCAANVNVASCEKNREKTRKLHVEATSLLASYGNTKMFIYISTDSVFGGEVGNYRESDITNPINYYAQTKLLGEKAALKANPHTLVIRTNIYGFHVPLGTSLAEWALSQFAQNAPIDGFMDVFFNPLYVRQLAEVIIMLERCRFRGLIHAGCAEKVSKYEFLIKLASRFGYHTDNICPVPIDSKGLKIIRPKNTTLCTDKIEGLLGYKLSMDNGINRMYIDYMAMEEYNEDKNWKPMDW